jgi:hypothetical protein
VEIGVIAMGTRRTSAQIIAATLIAFLGAVWTGAAVQIPQGGYLYADHHDDLMMPADGITVEGWFHLDAYPPEGVLRVPLVMKPASYAIVLIDRPKVFFLNPDSVDVGPFVQLRFSDYSSKAVNKSLRCDTIDRDSKKRWPDANPIPAREWMHVAFEMRDEGARHMFAYYLNGERLGRIGNSFVGGVDAPLYIGGAPASSPCAELGVRYTSWPGSVAIVRVSRGIRYDRRLFFPEWDLPVDDDTVALWRLFASAGTYQDLSGNGHTLFTANPLPVSPTSKLATTWGRLRTPPR